MTDQPFVPPSHNGVGPSCVGLPLGPWPTMLDFFVQRFPAIAPDIWHQRMAGGQVLDEHGVPLAPEQRYQAHQRAYYYRAVPHEPHIPFHEVILFQDEHLLVADKPHFLPVMPSGDYLQETVLVRLKRRLGIDTLVPIHRIDRDTAGLVLFSLQPETRARYHALFSQRRVKKIYEAIAPWRDEVALPPTLSSRIVEADHFMLQREVSGTPNAITHLTVLEIKGTLARYQLQPVTGKRHQLRLQMAALGLPIVGDGLYPTLTPKGQANYAEPLQLLAKAIEFIDPLSGRPQHFQSERTLSFPTRAS